MSIQEHGIVHSRSQAVVDFAYRFAKAKHEEVGQVRKYTEEPYIVHPVAVAQLVASVDQGIDLIAAAFLHDTIEDTNTTFEEIRDAGFGYPIAKLVLELTDVYISPEHGNRAERKRKERERIATISPWAKTVKLADLIDNTRTIVLHDENFAKVYMREKQLLLEVLTEGHPVLLAKANELIKDYYLKRLED